MNDKYELDLLNDSDIEEVEIAPDEEFDDGDYDEFDDGDYYGDEGQEELEELLDDEHMLTVGNLSVSSSESDFITETLEQIKFKQNRFIENVKKIFKKLKIKGSIKPMNKKSKIFDITINELDFKFRAGIESNLKSMHILLTHVKNIIDYNNGKVSVLKYYINEFPIDETVSHIEIKKHPRTEDIMLIIESTVLDNGTPLKSKVILSLINFIGGNYYYYHKDNELDMYTDKELLLLHEKYIGFTHMNNIMNNFMIFSSLFNILEYNQELKKSIESNNTNFYSVLSLYFGTFRDNERYVYLDGEIPGSVHGGKLSMARFKWLQRLVEYSNNGYIPINANGPIRPLNYTGLGIDFNHESNSNNNKSNSKNLTGENKEIKEVKGFDKVYELDGIKEEFRLLGEAMLYNKENPDNKVDITKGVLLIGPPGTGKTHITRAFVEEYDFRILELNNYSAGSGKLTVSAIRGIFNDADYYTTEFDQPVIIFIDEIDKIITKNNDEMLSALLDYLSRDTKALVIAAGNSTATLHEALLRPGRFDKKIYFGDLPSVTKENILRNMLENREIPTENLNISMIVDYLPTSVTTSTLEAIVKNIDIRSKVRGNEVNTVMAIEVSEEILEGISEVVQLNEKSRESVAWHEAGHAAVGLLAGMRMTLATIERGHGYYGFVRFKFSEDEADTFESMENDILASLGGWAAEKIVYNTSSVGASSDFQYVQMMVNYLISWSGDDGLNLVSTTPYFNINSSDLEKRDSYKAKSKRMNKYSKKVLNMLKKNYTLLEDIKNALVKKGKVSGEELENIYSLYKSKKRRGTR